MSKGILNLECAVHPPGRSKDATPEDATASTTFFNLKFVIIAFHRNVLPVPPWPHTKKKLGDPLRTHSVTV
jgi:hypothetical protein